MLTHMTEGIELEQLAGPPVETVEVRSVTADSRRAGPGVVFVAVPGTFRDGHDFAGEAARAGSPVIIVERWVEGLEEFERCVVMKSPRARLALAHAAANLHGRPGERLRLVGVTGTNGKTTVTWLLASALEHSGLHVGLLGTVGMRKKGKLSDATHTTPGPEALQEILADLVGDGAELGVMEVSSHALDQERVAGCRFVATAFTGLSRDHLDYHPDMEHYFRSKSRLFAEHLADEATAVIFVDEPFGRRLHTELSESKSVRAVFASIAPATRRGERARAGLPGGPGVIAVEAVTSLTGIEAVIELPGGESCEVKSKLVGEHNLANLTVAAGLAHALGIDHESIGRGLSSCEGVPGRLERVVDPGASEDEQRYLFVDYAHTDDALARVIDGLRAMAPPTSRIVVVAGCGGDRDRGKRALMGRAASGADVVIVTSDNPRSEDPVAIAGDMEAGIERVPHAVELDRKAAIELAVGISRPGDVVLVAGKGHESVQLVGAEARPFDDREVSRAALTAVAAGTRPIPAQAKREEQESSS